MGDEVDRSRPEILENFVGCLRRLMSALARMRPNDAMVLQTQKRVSLAADALPVSVLEVSGPYLYMYRERIMSDDPAVWQQFFRPGAFDQDLQDAEDPNKRDAAAHLIPAIQEIVSGMPRVRQAEYIETVRTLLDDYMDWLLLAA